MDVLFATGNPAKVKSYYEKLKEKGINLLTIKDIDVKVDVEENGKNALENARIKAKAYYEATGMVSIGMDNTLFFENIPDEKQPGTFVRRVNGKRLSDEEMIQYYIDFVRENGDNLHASWRYGMAIYNGKEMKEFSWSKDSLVFVSKASENRNPGYPLDSIAIVPKFNKYLVDLNEEERKENQKDAHTDEVIDFIVKSVEE